MPQDVQRIGRSIKFADGKAPHEKAKLVRAEVREGLSQITELDMDFMIEGTAGKDVDVNTMVGKLITIEIEIKDPDNGIDTTKYFTAHIIEISFERVLEGEALYSARCRNWLWFLTQTTDCRIFQNQNAEQIITAVFAEYGFESANHLNKSKLSGRGQDQRIFCVQYRETDYDFVYRLMVEEGITYYVLHENGKDIVHLVGAAAQLPDHEPKEFEYHKEDDAAQTRPDFVWDWSEYAHVRTAQVTLNDFDFKKPSTELLLSSKATPEYTLHNKYEVYDYPGRYHDDQVGTTITETRQQAHAAQFRRFGGECSVRWLATGHRFTLAKHVRDSLNIEYFVIEAVHQMQIESDYDDGALKDTLLGRNLRHEFGKMRAEGSEEEDGKYPQAPRPYRVLFSAQKHGGTVGNEFRPPYPCRRPVIPGLQTATVVGPQNDEIYTDAYGRVKVHFHWDRIGERNENDSCWIRKAEPWTGAGWGMQWIPRVGQEVVVQFEEGDPDRPMIVGMLFNNAKIYPTFRGKDEAKATLTSQDEDGNSLASALPANKTMMGWTTRSTKGGKAGTFHELVFEDKLNAEFVRFQSERDFKSIVKNNAEYTYGLEHKDKGDVTITIHNSLTETLNEGDHKFTVSKGKEDYTVEKDRTVTMNANHVETISKDQTSKITGNQNITVSKSQTTTVTQKITTKANSKITLKCGGSTIEMTPSKISIKSVQVEINGSASAKLLGGKAEVTGTGMVMVGAPMVKIN